MSESEATLEDPVRRSELCVVKARPPVLQAVAFVSLLLIVISLTFVTCVLLFEVALISAQSLVVLLSLEIAAIVTASVVLGRARGDRFDLFEPSMMVNIVFLLNFCVRPIYLMAMMSQLDADFVAMNPAVTLDYAWAVGYQCLGLACFHVGYYALKRHFRQLARPQSTLSRWNTRRVTRVALVGGVLAMVSVAIDVSVAGGIAGAFANVGRLREIDAGYAYGLLGAAYFPILVVLLLVDHLLGHPRKLLITFFVVMTVGYNALTGNRTTILATFLSCLIVYVYIRGIKKPWRFAALSTAIGLVVFSALVFWAFTRSYNISISDIPRIVNIMRDEDSVTFYSQIIGEFSAVDSFAAILHGGPSVFPFRYGETYLDVALFVVPRAVWPNKPKSFGRAVGDYVTENGNDVPPGEVAELYINWHVFGIVIGMFFLGWLMDLIYCRAVGGSAGTLAMYGLLIPYVGALLSHDAVDGLVILLTVVLPMWPAVLYIEAVKSREFIAT